MAEPTQLNADQKIRYQRHLLLPEVGVEGQAKLLGAKVLLLGAGGLGSPAALYLAAAGVGTLGIVDMDVVDESNLQRQILHNIDRIGDRKVDSAKKTLTVLNPDVNVVAYDTRLDAGNVLDIIDGYDVIIDGADNFPSRYLLNDASLKKKHPRRARLDLPLRGPGHGVQPLRRPLLPLHGARAAAGRARTVVRRSRCARRAARHHRLDPGARGDQAASSASATRSPAASWPTTRSSSRSAPTRCCATRVPRLLARPGRHRHRRVRRALHAAPPPLSLTW